MNLQTVDRSRCVNVQPKHQLQKSKCYQAFHATKLLFVKRLKNDLCQFFEDEIQLCQGM